MNYLYIMNSKKINRKRFNKSRKTKRKIRKIFQQQGGRRWDNIGLSILLGGLGADRIYHGCWKSGIAKLISQAFQPIGLGWWITDAGYAIMGREGYLGCNDAYFDKFINKQKQMLGKYSSVAMSKLPKLK